MPDRFVLENFSSETSQPRRASNCHGEQLRTLDDMTRTTEQLWPWMARYAGILCHELRDVERVVSYRSEKRTTDITRKR